MIELTDIQKRFVRLHLLEMKNIQMAEFLEVSSTTVMIYRQSLIVEYLKTQRDKETLQHIADLFNTDRVQVVEAKRQLGLIKKRKDCQREDPSVRLRLSYDDVWRIVPGGSARKGLMKRV